MREGNGRSVTDRWLRHTVICIGNIPSRKEIIEGDQKTVIEYENTDDGKIKKV